MSLTYAPGLHSCLTHADEAEALALLQRVADQLDVSFVEVVAGRAVELRPGEPPADKGEADAALRAVVAASRGSAPYACFPGYFDDASVLIPGDHSDYALLELPGQPVDGLGVVTLGEALREMGGGESDEEVALVADLRAAFERCQRHRLIFVLHTF